MINKVEATLGAQTISFETGKIARQASGSVLVRCGDTAVLVTAVGVQLGLLDQNQAQGLAMDLHFQAVSL